MNWRLWLIFSVIALIIEIPLFIIGVRPVIVLIITFIIIAVGYLVWWSYLRNKLNGILEEKCDPSKFIEECEKAKLINKRAAFQNFCKVNIAVGLLSLGRNCEALDILLQEVDIEAKNSVIFKSAYHLALFCCYLNTDDLDKATYEYENYLKEFRKKIIQPKFLLAIDASFAEYQYKLSETAETAKVFLGQLEYLYSIYSKKISKRTKLNIIFNKAGMLFVLEDYEAAAKKYKIVADNGNGLYIAEMSRVKLREIEMRIH